VKQGISFTRLDWHAPTPIFLPGGGNIVLAHAPRCGWQTAISAVGGHDGGNPDLRDALRKTSDAPWLIFSGHVHNPASWKERQGKTWSFNPGFNSNGQRPNHTVIDTEKHTASWFCDGRLADEVSLE
jgi:Icc-related predicted phosphoesterase